jgi:hypothetical protein
LALLTPQPAVIGMVVTAWQRPFAIPRMSPGIGKRPWKGPLTCTFTVGDTGFEPVTSSVSRKRATTAPIALDIEFEVGTGFEPV